MRLPARLAGEIFATKRMVAEDLNANPCHPAASNLALTKPPHDVPCSRQLALQAQGETDKYFMT